MLASTCRGTRRCAPPALPCASPEALDTLVAAAFTAYRGELLAYARKMTRDPDVAEDIVAEAFCRLTVQVRAGATPVLARSWLYRVVANLVVSRARHAAVAERAGPRLVALEGAHSPETELLDLERRSDLADALETLPGDARLGLVLAAIGFSGREIALRIGRSEAATRTYLHRGRRRMRTRLELGAAP